MLDSTQFQAAMKTLYGVQKMAKLTENVSALFNMLPKMEKFYGANLPLPVKYGNGGGRSANSEYGYADATGGDYGVFTLTRASDFAHAHIQNEVIESSKNDVGAFVSALETELDGAIESLMQSISGALFGSGTGSIGQISSDTTLASTTLKLADAEDVVNYAIGQKLVTSATDGGSLRTGSITVTGIDRDAGTLTLSGNVTAGIAAADHGDYIYVRGDHNAKIKGLAAWLPYVAPTSGDSFFGKDRSVDPVRLAGVRMDLTGYSATEAVKKLARRIKREGGRPDTLVCHDEFWEKLENELQSKANYETVAGGTGFVGFKAIVVNGPTGPIKVIADSYCPVDYIYCLTLSTWKLYSLGKMPRIWDDDGNKLERGASGADSVSFKALYRAQLGCDKPGHNGVGKVS